MLVDWGTYANLSAGVPKIASFDKDYVKTFELAADLSCVMMKVTDSIKYYVTYDTANTDPAKFIVDSVEGVVPTSNTMLLNLLSQTKYITYLAANISAANTYVLKTGWGVLHAVNITSAVVSSNVKVYDGGVSGTLLAEIPFGLALLQSQVNLLLDVRFMTSLVVVTTGAVKVQVSYK